LFINKEIEYQKLVNLDYRHCEICELVPVNFNSFEIMDVRYSCMVDDDVS